MFSTQDSTQCFDWAYLAGFIENNDIKFNRTGGRKLAMDKGLIMNTGLMACMASPASSTSLRIGLCLDFY
ncbi:hypothetical protein [Paraflavitalea speifideaquila]|uniref:hypothetical protein n=1 Tax=Paraflavitalea speifideaquila TaxID=3076558 RepID=UPI0028E2DC77|nr:hypothetical protein [Paraflavitalea speifideiaquila]